MGDRAARSGIQSSFYRMILPGVDGYNATRYNIIELWTYWMQSPSKVRREKWFLSV